MYIWFKNVALKIILQFDVYSLCTKLHKLDYSIFWFWRRKYVASDLLTLNGDDIITKSLHFDAVTRGPPIVDIDVLKKYWRVPSSDNKFSQTIAKY